MCGIDGLFSKNVVESESIRKMTSSLIHRGPHSEGFYDDKNIGLGMRRLKVIDLKGGDQPILNEKKDVIVIFNGEIYNYQKLRKNLQNKGHIFESNTDSEVLAHGYEEWGIDELLSRINGMFGFCIYDKKIRKVYLARDRIGEKPLYYFFDNSTFVFGSELQSILESQKIPIQISKLGLYYYLALHYVPGDMSIIEGVKKLLPGHYIKFDLDDFTFDLIQFWEPKEKHFEHNDISSCIQHTKNLVINSIKERKKSDVKIGVFLSGGLDSSIIASVMKQFHKDIDTFSIGFDDPNFDETEYSTLISSYLNTNHHHFILKPEKIIELLPKVSRYIDEPLGDPAIIPVYWLSHEAKNFVTVVLGGEGGDEIFAGYTYYKKNSSYSLNSLFSIIQFDKLETLSGFPIVADHTIISKLIKNFNFDEIKSASNNFVWSSKILKNYKNIEDKLRQRQYIDIKTWLPDDLLMKFDKMTMANSLEGRAPFLDYFLVDYAFNLPAFLKIKDENYKFILKEAFKDSLPEKIINRKKQGFNLPISDWLKTNLKPLVEDISSFDIDDGIEQSYLNILIEEHMSGKFDRGRLIFSIMMYRLWAKNLFERFVN